MPKRRRQLTGLNRASQRSKTRAWKVSELKINENKIPEESTVIPSTSSDSASTRSNGALSTASKTRPKPVSETSFQKQNCATNETPRADQSKYENTNKSPRLFRQTKISNKRQIAVATNEFLESWSKDISSNSHTSRRKATEPSEIDEQKISDMTKIEYNQKISRTETSRAEHKTVT